MPLFSPQLYFIEEQGGELQMDWFGGHLTTAEQTNSFEFSDQFRKQPTSCLIPIPMDSRFCTFNLSAKEVHFNAMSKTNQNLTAPKQELLGWHQKIGHCGFNWVQSLMIPRYPQYQVPINQEGGQYLGSSTSNASTIGRIRNLETGHVSPQFCVVYDTWFNTVPNAGDPELQGEVD
jgi:hypothetical protein